MLGLAETGFGLDVSDGHEHDAEGRVVLEWKTGRLKERWIPLDPEEDGAFYKAVLRVAQKRLDEGRFDHDIDRALDDLARQDEIDRCIHFTSREEA